jgi:acetyl/propionyl-CoA carboxylase alpha subunit
MALFQLAGETHDLDLVPTASGWTLQHGGKSTDVHIQEITPGQLLVQIGEQRHRVSIARDRDQRYAAYNGQVYTAQRLQKRPSAAESTLANNRIEAPLTGKVLVVSVKPGEQVTKGQTLLILESMKMETALTASMDAQVKNLSCHVGDQVSLGQLLVELDPTDA